MLAYVQSGLKLKFLNNILVYAPILFICLDLKILLRTTEKPNNQVLTLQHLVSTKRSYLYKQTCSFQPQI